MTAIFAVQTTIEFIAVLLLIWGFMNEKKFVAFENKLAHAVGVNIRNHRRRKLAQLKQAELASEQPAPVIAKKPFCVPDITEEYRPNLQEYAVWVA